MMYLEAFRTKGEAFKSKRFLIGFAVAAALCILIAVKSFGKKKSK